MAFGGGIVGIIVLLFSIVSIVCWIMTLIKIFKESVGLGILGIVCSLFAFIYGWVKCKEYDNKNVMVVWTLVTIVIIILQFVMMGQLASEIQNNMPAMETYN